MTAWFVLFVLGLGFIDLAGNLGDTNGGNPLDPASLAALATLIASGAWAVLMEVAIGFAVAFVARSSIAGIAAIVGLFFAGRFAEMFVPANLLRFTPITAAEGLVRTAGNAGLDASLAIPLAMTTFYLLAAVGIAGLVGRRAEVA